MNLRFEKCDTTAETERWTPIAPEVLREELRATHPNPDQTIDLMIQGGIARTRTAMYRNDPRPGFRDWAKINDQGDTSQWIRLQPRTQ